MKVTGVVFTYDKNTLINKNFREERVSLGWDIFLDFNVLSFNSLWDMGFICGYIINMEKIVSGIFTIWYMRPVHCESNSFQVTWQFSRGFFVDT